MTNWLLLRGFTRDQRHWGEFPEQLADALTTTVAVIDAPGFGTERRRRSPRSIDAITDDIRARFDPGAAAWSILIHPTAGHDLPVDDAAWTCGQIREWAARPERPVTDR